MPTSLKSSKNVSLKCHSPSIISVTLKLSSDQAKKSKNSLSEAASLGSRLSCRRLFLHETSHNLDTYVQLVKNIWYDRLNRSLTAMRVKLTRSIVAVKMCWGKKTVYSCGCYSLQACIGPDCDDWTEAHFLKIECAFCSQEIPSKAVQEQEYWEKVIANAKLIARGQHSQMYMPIRSVLQGKLPMSKMKRRTGLTMCQQAHLYHFTITLLLPPVTRKIGLGPHSAIFSVMMAM